MPSSRRLFVAAVIALLALAGCSQGSSATAGAEGTPSTLSDTGSSLPAGVVIVDVRTPAEFADGHLQGAVNIDVQSPTFADDIARLDPGATTFVYCRSGNRSAAALELMAEAGFDDLVDLGSVQAAAEATGLPVVT